uniref:Uncharacterized protein n=1 Tax=Rhizophora mucronata TaxID=61149 RepID=A0A2P2MI88_RHIMU
MFVSYLLGSIGLQEWCLNKMRKAGLAKCFWTYMFPCHHSCGRSEKAIYPNELTSTIGNESFIIQDESTEC